MVQRPADPFDGGDVGRATRTPAAIGIARLEPHRFRHQLHPVAQSHIIAAVERGELPMAGMEDGRDGVAVAGSRSRPRLARRLGERAWHGGERAAHVPGMGWPVDQLQAWNVRQQARDAVVDGHVRREAQVPVQ